MLEIYGLLEIVIFIDLCHRINIADCRIKEEIIIIIIVNLVCKGIVRGKSNKLKQILTY